MRDARRFRHEHALYPITVGRGPVPRHAYPYLIEPVLRRACLNSKPPNYYVRWQGSHRQKWRVDTPQSPVATSLVYGKHALGCSALSPTSVRVRWRVDSFQSPYQLFGARGKRCRGCYSLSRLQDAFLPTSVPAPEERLSGATL